MYHPHQKAITSDSPPEGISLSACGGSELRAEKGFFEVIDGLVRPPFRPVGAAIFMEAGFKDGQKQQARASFFGGKNCGFAGSRIILAANG